MYENKMFKGLEEELIPIFAERLKQIRTKAGLTQQQFATEVGISVAALSYYETGKRVPDIVFLQKVSDYFMIPVDYFLGSTNSTKKENVNISDSLGLSDKAIEMIRRYIDDANFDYYENSDILNRLLSNDDFYSVLNLLIWGGSESTTYMPDEDYICFIAMKKMIKVIQDIIISSADLKARIMKSVMPEQKEREQYYKWLSEKADAHAEDLQEAYKQRLKKLETLRNESVDRFKASQNQRITALNKLEEAENNGKHNPESE